MKRNNTSLRALRTFFHAAALGLCTTLASPYVLAEATNLLPGKGFKIQMVKTNADNEIFQTLLVMKALEQLGYDVKPYQEMSHP